MAFLNKLRSNKKLGKSKIIEELQPTTSEEKELIPTSSEIPISPSNEISVMPDQTQEVTTTSISSDESKHQNGTTDSQSSSTELPQCIITLKSEIYKLKNCLYQFPQEHKEIIRLSGLAILSLMALFVSVVLLRFIRHIVSPQESGIFCTYFAGPFCPLFDALCEEQESYLAELLSQINQVSYEANSGFKNFFKSIFDGFAAIQTILWAIFGGTIDTIYRGYEELMENMGENVNHLISFIRNCISLVFKFIFLAFNTIFNSFFQLLNSVKTVFVEEHTKRSLW